MNTLRRTVRRSEAARREIVRRVRELGWWGMLIHLARKVAAAGKSIVARSDPDAFDFKYGTDTAGNVGVWALGLPLHNLGHANRYETVASEVFLGSLMQVQINYPEFVFIDLGSGKGRTLLIASQLPFKAIIGVELSPLLHETARRNFRIFKDESIQCVNLESICKDVLEYEFPEEHLVLYLYNPFDERIMESVVAKVEGFVKRTSKRVYVLYHHPVHRKVWEEAKLFDAIGNGSRFALYMSKPEEAERV